MCDQLFHSCRYCGKDYDCLDPNWLCPTINHDENMNMCTQCQAKEREDFRKAMERGEIPEDKKISIDDWEFEK